jgi:multidrug resistance efflux pump
MNKFRSFTVSFINLVYFVLVFAVAFAISSLALSRKINSYEAQREPLFFSVQKENIEMTSPVGGRLDSVEVKTGQHVKKGELIAQLSDEALERKLEALEKVSERNLSAETEAQVLRSQKEQFSIRAPKDGVIYKINSASGSFVGQGTPIITMFADERVKLVGYVNPSQYAEIQKTKELNIYSPRFQQIYRIVLEGVGRVQSGQGYDQNRYELVFDFADPEEGPAFLEGESLEVVNKVNDGDAKRPASRIVDFWNSFIIGK